MLKILLNDFREIAAISASSGFFRHPQMEMGATDYKCKIRILAFKFTSSSYYNDQYNLSFQKQA